MEIKHNLPQSLTRFIGREPQLAHIEQLLRSYRLLTLTGPGGVGKTRLALQAAANLLPEFSGGVWLVRLAHLTAPVSLWQAVSQSLGLAEISGQSLPEIVLAWLRPKESLLVLDNCEHLVEDCARLAETLLSEGPALRILATSRESLGIPAEKIMPVPSLTLPVQSTRPLALDPIPFETGREAEALQFFVDRAQAAQPGFEITGQNFQAISRICFALDGIPLALELAAARLNVLNTGQIATRLDHSFQLLTGGSRTALPRQQTLRALIDWSHALLTEREQVLFRRLAAFRGGWTIDAAEEICQGIYTHSNGQGKIEPDEILDLLAQLVNKSLVQVDHSQEIPRYTFLETMRQYARLKLDESGEAARIFERHAACFLALAEQVAPLLWGKDQTRWYNRLELEYPNLRAALGWLRENAAANPEKFMRLAAALLRYWQHFYHWQEAMAWLDAALQIQPDPTNHQLLALRAEVARAASVILHTTDEFAQATQYHEEDLRIQQIINDNVGQSRALLEQGWTAYLQTNFEEAYDKARRSLGLVRSGGDKRIYGPPLQLMGVAALSLGKFDESLEIGQQSLAIWRELQDAGSIASDLTGIALVYMAKTELNKAGSSLAEALELHTTLQNKIGLMFFLDTVAKFALRAGQTQAAARIRGYSLKLSSSMTGNRPPISNQIFSELGRVEQYRMNDQSFEKLVNEGQAMSFDEIVSLTRTVCQSTLSNDSPSTPAARENYPAGLTEREVEVLRLLAGGLSNPDIAEKLVISRRTVESHLRSIYDKIEVTSRTAASRYAIDHRLT